jgi:hypothetical protein
MRFSDIISFVLVIICVFVLPHPELKAQEDLSDLLEKETDDGQSSSVSSTFKGTRLINGHSVELRKRGALEFIISHRFGTINSGIENLFGLDDANMRIGLDYSITDRFTIGAGRSSFQKVYDGFVKYKVLSQSAGSGSFPFTMVYYSSMAINTLKWSNPERPYRSTDRYSFAHQFLLARKFGSGTSVQLMPSLVHRNLVPESQEENLIYALGVGGRQKLTGSLALTFEYYYQFNNESSLEYNNSVSFGFDIETGGHVFQLHFTNSNPTFERGFITETTGDFFHGDIHFGFNITRTFQLGRKLK